MTVDELKAKRHAYYLANKHKWKEYSRAYRLKHPEDVSAQKVAWREKNRERIKEYSRMRREKDGDGLRAKRNIQRRLERVANRDAVRAADRQRYAALGAAGREKNRASYYRNREARIARAVEYRREKLAFDLLYRLRA
jgi:hypothetical protein